MSNENRADGRILEDVKRNLNIHPDEHEFDNDIRVYTNGAFLTLHQLGVGPSDAPFSITNSTTWSEFNTSIPYDVILDYLFLKVKTVFDPPQVSAVIEAYKNQISELEFRMNIQVDDGGGNVTG